MYLSGSIQDSAFEQQKFIAFIKEEKYKQTENYID